MEWSTKFEWDNLDIDGSCFNLPEVIGDSGGSVSDVGKQFVDKNKEGSVCSSEPFIGLKLGKRTYFENGYAKNNKVSSVFGVPVPSVVSAGKKVKQSGQSTLVSRCQVEGCNLDLSSAKEYHRKHKVCEGHSKSPKVIVAGLERRFCQQCSRFAYEVYEEVRKMFKSQFAEPMRRRPSFDNYDLPELSVEQKTTISAPFSCEEVLYAIRECKGGKAPGPDGFTFHFFRRYWDLLKPMVMKLMADFFVSGRISSGCNASFVALIPKKTDPQVINDFRPISLIGSIYKIVAKTLANRLKPVMGALISPHQAAFVGGRNILDNPMIISELVSWKKHKKEKLMIFKVDFQKAFDSLNWKFLFKTMEYLGFPDVWLNWVKGCLESGRGSVLVNGSPTGEFSFKRGLRQGCPMSPYLFILAMEVVGMFMRRAVDLGLFHGVKTPNEGPCISHLCYADDVLFIGEWSEHNIVSLSRLLRCIYLVTGLKVNHSKCQLHGIGVDEDEVGRMASILNCDIGALPFMYLGIPIGVNMKRIKFWQPIIDKFNRRLSSWKANSLSFAGRVTLAKAVLGSLPSYYLSFFKAPKTIVKKLEGIRRDFVWGRSNRKKKIRWVRWERLLRHKKLGGVGIGGIGDFNDAMLLKWWWRFKDNPTHLWARVVHAIHSTQNNKKMIPVKKLIPGVWKDIGGMDDVLARIGISIQDRLRVEVKNGMGTSFWKDVWAGSAALKVLFPNLYRLAKNKNGKVADYAVTVGDITCWGWEWAKNPSSNQEWAMAGDLMNLLGHFVFQHGGDVWKWDNNEGHNFSTKSLRMELNEVRAGVDENKLFFWNSWATPKANFLAWRALQGRVASKLGLAARGVHLPNLMCDRCGYELESPDHIFVSCLFARCIWWNIFRWIKVPMPPECTSLGDLLESLHNTPGSQKWKRIVHMVALASIWRIWIARNKKVFDGKFITVQKTVEDVKEDAFVWISHRANNTVPSWDDWISFDVSIML
ncbi:putative RNA-directed DNA polymerase transcription factor SBP family [Helianthus annuus]|nr:putative RNA-directed DNA polymerase transcription factor SBP family [Helianthus annuus]